MHKTALKKLLQYNSYGYTLSKIFSQYLFKENLSIPPEKFGYTFYSSNYNNRNFSYFLKGFMTCEKLFLKDKYLSNIELKEAEIFYIEHHIKCLVNSPLRDVIIEVNRLNHEFNSYISAMNNERLIFKKYFNIYKEMNHEKLDSIVAYNHLNKVLEEAPEGAEYYFVGQNEYTRNYVINKKSYSYEIFENGEWIQVGSDKPLRYNLYSGGLLMKDILISLSYINYYHSKVNRFLRGNFNG